MAAIPGATVDHYRHLQRLQAVAVASGRRAWRHVEAGAIGASWADAVTDLLPVVEGSQFHAAMSGATYSAMTLAQQGRYVAPTEFVDPHAIAGYASDGRSLDGLLYSPATTAKAAIARGVAPAAALEVGRGALDRILSTIVADAGRQAAGADVAARPGTGYVRMLNPPSCSRCAILAGRFYRWNAGFQRHPHCDCVHVAATVRSTAAAQSEGLIDDPYDYFRSLDESEQDRVFTKAGAQALRDGADISQVVNARRGMTPNGNFTAEGTTKRGYAHSLLKPRQRRMTPELIYQQADGSRERAVELLKEHGYIVPGGQVAGGALRGQREGFGAMGRGGTRKAASEAVLEARRTGIRDPRNRYTMTEAERRVYDARRRYEVAMSGVSPYTSPGFGQTPDPYGLRLNRTGGSAMRPVTPTELALAEQEYRWALAGSTRPAL